jgi:carbonic anhydrase/acetyltransferase-like protein (isoleucine patch superfamily)
MIHIYRIGTFTSIGDNTVIHTASSLPTGLPAAVDIGVHCTIQSGCSLYSCIVEDEVFIGAKSVILEGSRIEKGAVIAPNSVVPPGRLIPARQVWGGNPVEFIREVHESEYFSNYTLTYENWALGRDYSYQYTPWNYSYLKIESSKEDVDLKPEEIMNVFDDKSSFIKSTKYYI